MTIDYGWVSESLRATAERRDGQITYLLGIELGDLHRFRRTFSKASAIGADELTVIRRVGLPDKMFRWWRKLEDMSDAALEAEVKRFRERVEQERSKRSPSTSAIATARSRNERLGKPYVGAKRVTPRVYASGPVPGWWHGGE